MISELQINDTSRCAVGWWDKAPALKKRKSLKFEPGLNVLWGRNGVGKSTVIRTISNLFCCGQSGRPFVSHTTVDDLYHETNAKKFDDEHPDGVLPVHDGQAVLVFNPDLKMGLRHGGSAFDYDFMEESIQNMKKVSSGQQTARALIQQVAPFITGEKEWPEIHWKMDRNTINPVWKKRADFLTEFFKASIEVGPRTIIMDEPEKSLDLDGNEKIWEAIRHWATTHQVIVATHSVFALGIEGANYIELKDPMDKGTSYLQNCEESLLRAPLFQRMEADQLHQAFQATIEQTPEAIEELDARIDETLKRYAALIEERDKKRKR